MLSSRNSHIQRRARNYAALLTQTPKNRAAGVATLYEQIGEPNSWVMVNEGFHPDHKVAELKRISKEFIKLMLEPKTWNVTQRLKGTTFLLANGVSPELAGEIIAQLGKISDDTAVSDIALQLANYSFSNRRSWSIIRQRWEVDRDFMPDRSRRESEMDY